MRRTCMIALVFLALFISTAALAAVPQTLHYSGKLDAGGGAFTGTVDVAFALYVDANAASSFWSDTQAVLENRVEMFAVLAGSGYPYDVEGRRALFQREIDRASNMSSCANHGLVVAATERWYHRLGEVTAPTLVIHGDEDPILPLDHGRAIAEAIAGATLLVLEGAGHEIPEGTLDQVIPAILEATT